MPMLKKKRTKRKVKVAKKRERSTIAQHEPNTRENSLNNIIQYAISTLAAKSYHLHACKRKGKTTWQQWRKYR